MSKNVLITGAASGIGQGLAETMAAKGMHLIVSDLSDEGAKTVADKLVGQGYSAEPYQLDVSSQSEIDTLTESFSNIDVLINNAGIQHVASLEDFPPDHWRKLMDVLLIGPAMLTRSLLPKMKARNFGRIINIGSIHALVASPYKSAYVAAKHGLLGFSKVVALETGEQDITINTICPSYVKTPLVDKQIAAQAQAHNMSEEDVINTIMLEPMPKKAFIEMDELAESALFLMSNAARNITGQTIVLDGGWTAR